MYCIGFNGPPRSGKDSIATEIHEGLQLNISTMVKSLSMPMRLTAFAMIGEEYSLERYEEAKDKPHDVFLGQTMREFMIQFSEEFAKPQFGASVWANVLISATRDFSELPGILLVPDIGFKEEVAVLDHLYDPKNFLLVRLYREGITWNNDSRYYCSSTNVIDIDNDDSIEDAANAVLDYAETKLGWTL